MKEYLVDTSPLSGLVTKNAYVGKILLSWYNRGQLATSLICYGEVFERLQTHRTSYELKDALNEILEEVTPLAVSRQVLENYARLRIDMREQQIKPIGDIDTLIAATAITHDLIIVTSDLHFSRVPGIRYIYLDRNSY